MYLYHTYMSKQLSRFVCTACGAHYAAWAGRCSQCGDWNTLQEEVIIAATSSKDTKHTGSVLRPHPITAAAQLTEKRITCGMGDIDTVLGGGIVSGGVYLIAGQPGIGKSTLLMQLVHTMAQAVSVLYVSGEESEHQVGMRAVRLGANAPQLHIVASTSADDIAATIASGTHSVVVVDSIQTVTSAGVGAAPGSVSQISNSTHLLLTAAKASNVALIIVGHVTKEGSIAGPKILEHIVDVVLQLEGDAFGGFKVLRAIKNRFGPTTEAAIMEMGDTGLRPVLNPSEALLQERQLCDGSVVLATLEGTRPLLVEVQALVNKTNYGYPKRAASGIDLNRINLLVAVLERRTKLQLSDQDIYINIVGGIRLNDPAADLAVCMAIGSAAKSLQLKKNAVVFGEVGLSGEIRHVPFIDKRLAEAKKLGFDCALGPRQRDAKKASSFLYAASDIRAALNEFLKK